jgi:hypothetical protein
MTQQKKQAEIAKWAEKLEGKTSLFMELVQKHASTRQKAHMQKHLVRAWKHLISAKRNVEKDGFFDDIGFHYDLTMVSVEYDLYRHDLHKVMKQARGDDVELSHR